MANIALLDQNTINQIAAGEVVERPASVVKELIENAIDAGATAVTAEIKDGGISFIRITDNGGGIEKSDISVAFLRHSTSKIQRIEDLLTIGSLGFRGEALSSIASVAQVELVTKTRTAFTGVRYLIEGGEEQSISEIGCPDGTTFIVRNLFFNTPARRKFLKSAMTEASYISDLMERLAISHPDISFKFINNNKTVLHTFGNRQLKDIIYHVYGRNIAAEVVAIDQETEQVSIKGFIGKPLISRGNRNYENYFINGRYIKSSIISKAIEEAYRPFSMQHKYPFTAIHFTIAPELIDVNVHPTKMEVRFHNFQELYQLTLDTIRDALHATNMIPKVSLTEEKQSIKKETVSAPEPFEVNRRRLEEEARAKSNSASSSFKDRPTPSFLTQISPKRDVAAEVKETEIGKLREAVLSGKPTSAGNQERYEAENRSDFNNETSLLGAKRNMLSASKYSTEVSKENSERANPTLWDGKQTSDSANLTSCNMKQTPPSASSTSRDVKDTSESINKTSGDKNETSEDAKDTTERFSTEDTKQSLEKTEDTLVGSENVREETEYTTERTECIAEKTPLHVTNESQMSLFSQKEEILKDATEKETPLLSEEGVRKARIIGQVFKTYWLIELENQLYIVDQHAAHEKVLYESTMKRLKEKEAMSQQLCPPIILTLNLREEAAIKERKEFLTMLGFEIEPFGGKEYAVSAVPADMFGLAGERLFLEFIDDLVEEISRGTPDVILEKIASLSCKAAVKGNQNLSVEEARELMNQLLTLENPFHCPHGRPVIVSMTKYDLEKKFKRVL